MLINLFSIFDPTSYFSISLNWLAIFIAFYIFPFKMYYLHSLGQKGFSGLLRGVNSMFRDISESNYLGITFVVVVAFIYVVLRNLIGLFPFIFTFTAHPLVTLGLGMTFWVSFFIMGWLKNFKNRAAHLVPEGRPLYLAPLIVVIEIISHLMRPFTLAIRLAANIIAGHLIIRLLSRIRILSLFGFVNSFFFQSILLVLEFGVSVIQGFVFRILLLLYGLEYY
jgi:F-type H+-transporting ATPase subunit a